MTNANATVTNASTTKTYAVAVMTNARTRL